MNKPVKVLIVEDSEDDAKLALRALRGGGFEPTYRRVQTAAELETALAEEHWDAVISDFSMPGFNGMDALRIFRATGLDIPFILVSGTIGEGAAVDAMKAGSSDYVMKKSLARLAPALERELKETQARAGHRRAQEALTDSEQRFRQMAENIRDVFFLRDVDDNRMLYISPAYEEIWGRSCESVYANPESWTEVIHPDDRASTYEKYKNGMSAGKYEFEYRIVRPDGSIRWIETRGFPVRDDAGKIVRVAGVVEDITERTQAVQELRESRQRLDGIVTSAMDAIVTVDEEQRIVLSNPAAERMFGYTAAELQGQPLDLLMPERFRAGHSAHITAFGKAGVTSRRMGELRPVSGVRKNDEEFPIEASISKDESTGRRFFTAILRDITERTKSDERILRLNRVYAVLSGINTLIVRARDRTELFGESCRIAVEEGKFPFAWIGEMDEARVRVPLAAWAGNAEEYRKKVEAVFGTQVAPRSAMDAVITKGKAVIVNDIATDPRIPLRDEAMASGFRSLVVLPICLSGKVIATFTLCAEQVDFFDEDEMKLLLELASDISFALDHFQKAEKLDYLAYYDALTGLANRSLFLERVAQYKRSAVVGGHRLAVCLIDLERFKNINDSLGRPAGDALLRQVAEWLTRNAGDANVLARVGADHFALVLPEVRQQGDVTRLIETTMNAFLEHPFQLDDAVFRIASKVGVAVFPDDGADAETLFRNAEAALKMAKASGDRYLFYTQKMTETVAGKLTLENQLRQALDNGEFVLYYQPKVNLSSGKLTGAEALIRWNDPRTGLVPPGRFIPVLEEIGLIHDVGRWALRQALADYLRWRSAGLPAVRIAVNVSPLQLRSRGFIAEIRQAIGVDAHAPGGLELEITESVIMEDVKHSIAILTAIRASGVTIAIDDFGTGFSSLSYLAKLPVDTLKIDRSFIVDMTVGPQGLALVSTIINLAHSLKLKVVAEGVETDEQSRLLRLLDCDEMQGFLFSKAVPGDAFEAAFLGPISEAAGA